MTDDTTIARHPASIDQPYAAAAVAVFLHLVRQIQDSADVRYYVGGEMSQMRALLVEALKASGLCGERDPLDALRPAPHRADDEPYHKQLERRLGEIEED